VEDVNLFSGRLGILKGKGCLNKSLKTFVKAIELPGGKNFNQKTLCDLKAG